MDVEVIYGQFIQSSQAFVAQHSSRESLQLAKMVLGVVAVVRLQQLRQKEYSVGLCRGEYGWLLCFSAHLFEFKSKLNESY